MNCIDPLLEVDEVELKNGPGARLIYLDASYFLVSHKRSGKGEFLNQHLPDARFFCIDSVAEHSDNLPHMLPSQKLFADSMSRLGISEIDKVVIYDNSPLKSSARVWWTFRLFGHENVFILNGGLPSWIDSGGLIESGEKKISPTNYNSAIKNDWLVAGFDDVRRIVNGSLKRVLIDARSSERFFGIVPELHEGLRSGSIPRSVNFPYTHVFDKKTGKYRAQKEVKNMFLKILPKFDPKMPITITCGSGVTAACVGVAALRSGFENVQIYDGSWAEWGSKIQSEY